MTRRDEGREGGREGREKGVDYVWGSEWFGYRGSGGMKQGWVRGVNELREKGREGEVGKGKIGEGRNEEGMKEGWD